VLLALLAVAVGAVPAVAATGTYVRLGQFTPVMPDTELVILPVGDTMGAVTIPAVGYGGLSDHLRIEPGDYVIGIRPAGTTGTPVVSSTLDAMPGSAYTLAVVGAGDGVGLSVVPDDLTLPPEGQARMRVFQAASPGPLDVRGPDGLDLGTALTAGEAGEYRSLPPGRVELDVGGAAGAGTTALAVTLGANQVVSVVLVERAGVRAAEVHVDAAGPVVVPPGPIDAGLGPGGDRATGMGVLGGLAVLAAGAATLLARRPGAVPSRRC
jgi:hypothetical protein